MTPDVACLGKAMANGLPLAAVVGTREVMEAFDRVFFSGTFGGETLSLAAAKVTIAEIRDAPVIEHMWTQGARLHTGLRESIARHDLAVSVIGQAPRAALLFCRGGEDWPCSWACSSRRPSQARDPVRRPGVRDLRPRRGRHHPH